MDNTIDNTFESANRVYDVRGVAPTINTCGGGGLQPKIIELEQTLEVNQNGTTNCFTSVQKDNLVMENLIIGGEQKHQSVKKDGICTCLTSSMGTGGGYVPMIAPQYRIRKLTPRECWRLMDFSDEDFEKAAAVNSNTQLYKQAGNSIVKNVLCEVFKQMM